MPWMFHERCESDGVPWSQFVASLCFLLEFSEFLVHSQRLVNIALVHHGQLHHMFPSGDFHQLLNKWSNSSAVISQPLMSSPLTPPSSSFEVAFSTLQSIPKFWITMHVYFHFKSPTFSSVGDFSPGMKWSDLTNLSCLERGLLVAVSLWALLVFLVSPWFRVWCGACGPVVLREKCDILRQPQTPSLAASPFLFPCSHPTASKD